MANYLSAREAEVFDVVEYWLHAEHSHQFRVLEIDQGKGPVTRRTDILRTYMPKHWEALKTSRFDRTFLEDEEYGDISAVTPMLILQVGQHALKLASNARAAYVWNEVAHDKSFSDATKKSWQLLSDYRQQLDDGSMVLPWATCFNAENLDSALQAYSDNPRAYTDATVTYIRTVGLTVAALMEQNNETSTIFVPTPGVDTGKLIPWRYQVSS